MEGTFGGYTVGQRAEVEGWREMNIKPHSFDVVGGNRTEFDRGETREGSIKVIKYYRKQHPIRQRKLCLLTVGVGNASVGGTHRLKMM